MKMMIIEFKILHKKELIRPGLFDFNHIIAKIHKIHKQYMLCKGTDSSIGFFQMMIMSNIMLGLTVISILKYPL